MLKILALLIFCASLLTQAVPAQAHAEPVSQARLQSRAIPTELRVAASGEADCCFLQGRCCKKSMCAVCYLPMPPRHEGLVTIWLESFVLLPSREDLARLILLGRDPPVPRPRYL